MPEVIRLVREQRNVGMPSQDFSENRFAAAAATEEKDRTSQPTRKEAWSESGQARQQIGSAANPALEAAFTPW